MDEIKAKVVYKQLEMKDEGGQERNKEGLGTKPLPKPGNNNEGLGTKLPKPGSF